ncbi:hypothetical protein GSI_11298 [Ganoderma sinense ZZ0214-1]|uniref:Flavin reductase like domain-containing protein n=1 Tax=Ganoderma sinense ZZ0214-1 TaxID=1077348 RepID=A0A2G8RYP2_9APHY|nr:hypothetical protein GSI_11298 [Ganoderma sinense ZZ0214-1]
MADTSLPAFNSDTRAKYTDSPNPTFSYGQKVDATEDGKKWLEGEKAGWTVVDPSKEDPRRIYKLMISGIIPRPIAFVSSVSESGLENIAPFSLFNQVSHNPPLVSVSIAQLPDGGLKDTADNIKKTKQFTVNIISEPFIENANITSIDSPPEVGEWGFAGLTKAPSVHVKAPRVKESAFSMECELFQAVDIIHPETGVQSATLVLGLVKYFHLRNDVLNERGVIDFAKLKPIARIGDISFTRVGDAFRLPRLEWAAEGTKIQETLKST